MILITRIDETYFILQYCDLFYVKKSVTMQAIITHVILMNVTLILNGSNPEDIENQI